MNWSSSDGSVVTPQGAGRPAATYKPQSAHSAICSRNVLHRPCTSPSVWVLVEQVHKCAVKRDFKS